MGLPRFGWLTTLRDGLVQLFYPSTCWVCGCFFPDAQEDICPACRLILTSDPHLSCARCSGTVGPHANVSGGCSSCFDEKFVFEAAFRMGPYQGLLRDVILRLKNSPEESLAEVVGCLWAQLLAPRLRALSLHAVVPVPLHWTRRYWERGFNQSEILARCLAKNLKIPCYPYCLRRLRRTPRQSLQTSVASRRANVHAAFGARARYNFAGKSVLLVDDVLTTGATVNEAARALRILKPEKIVVAVLARAGLDSSY